MAKWQRMAILGRRITMAKRDASLTNDVDALHCSVAERGHFVVYTVDSQRFTVPLAYLDTKIFRELFRISEEEFGLPRDGPIILPCDAASMKYIMSMLARRISKDVEKALLSSIVVPRHSTCSFAPVGVSREVAICSF
ncbi:auxin-responsive protein SAUR36-like [Ananas comosus]|uniref:Auxin-responsive protein SAUR36-like n=1 Tax=Ananas comosus TaxID=4615 RepID=A0A6P5GVD4_ANACO|nr:auxin-responsive protein SAUR36-like [Ananas comosus]